MKRFSGIDIFHLSRAGDKTDAADERACGRRPKSFLSRLKRDCRGATAVEFAMILPVFSYLLLGILEISVMFAMQVIVENAVFSAARQIRTGQAQSSADADTTFSTALCTELYNIINCGDILYDVQTFSTFAAVDLTVEYDADNEIITESFNAGSSESIVAVRVMYQWNFFTPLIGDFFEDTDSTNRRLLMATGVFRNEPYE